jgi:hypothetical protein
MAILKGKSNAGQSTGAVTLLVTQSDDENTRLLRVLKSGEMSPKEFYPPPLL